MDDPNDSNNAESFYPSEWTHDSEGSPIRPSGLTPKAKRTMPTTPVPEGMDRVYDNRAEKWMDLPKRNIPLRTTDKTPPKRTLKRASNLRSSTGR